MRYTTMHHSPGYWVCVVTWELIESLVAHYVGEGIDRQILLWRIHGQRNYCIVADSPCRKGQSLYPASLFETSQFP